MIMPSVLSKRSLTRWFTRSHSQPAPNCVSSGGLSPEVLTQTSSFHFKRKHKHSDFNHIMSSDEKLEHDDLPTPLQPIRKISRNHSMRRKKKKLEEFFARRSQSLSSSATSESYSHNRLSTCSSPEGLGRRVSECSAGSMSEYDQGFPSPNNGRKWSNTSLWSQGSSPGSFFRSLSKVKHCWFSTL